MEYPEKMAASVLDGGPYDQETLRRRIALHITEAMLQPVGGLKLVATVFAEEIRRWTMTLDAAIGELDQYSRSQERVGGGTSTDFSLEALREMRADLARLLQ
jgi:hypothetical protein